MRLNIKWFITFSIVGIYVMFLGGLFYYNLFKWTFDEKLKGDVLEMVSLKSPELMSGLLRSSSAITFDEYGVIEFLKNDKRIVDVLYIDGGGRVRWFKQPDYLGMDFETFTQETGFNPVSVLQAYQTGRPSIIEVNKMPFYDIAIPFKAKGEDIIGVLNVRISREGAKLIVSSAMRKYIIGAFGILLLLGLPLYFFLKYYVITPITALTDSVDGVSSKNFQIKFGSRNDEIGDLAHSIAGFLEKVRQELELMSAKESQRQTYEAKWWEIILNAVVAKGNRALVVDEDNSVLFANFPLNKLDPEQKLHLLDVIDTDRQDVLRLVGMAMETPHKVIEGDTILKSEPVHTKVVQVQGEGSFKRTLVLFEKKQG